MTTPLRDQLAATLPGYLIQDELRGGGMSRVFVALDMALDRRVVIKVLAPDRAGILSAERFRKEALLAASLQHPHIVPILAAGAVHDVPYLVMPFVDGLSLRDRLERDGRLPLRDAVRILVDVARACAYAHERGIVHRDIKPDNVLMSGDAAMITDFGVARAIAAGNRASTDSRLTQEGFTVGSPRYMSPEQATGDPDIDHRVDIYSFGVLAFELVAGKPPFDSPSSSELLRAHLTTPPPDLRALRPDTPAALAELVTWCLAKRREDRPATATVLVEALEDPGIVSSSHARRSIAGTTSPSRWIWAAAGVVLLAAVAIGAWRMRASATLPLDSIAVLPVIDRTSDSTSEWMATGLTDEVTAVLGRVPGLRVAARRTVESFRSASASPQSIAHDLGVATVLDATLTRTDSNSYQLAAQLINGQSGLVLWSASIRGGSKDVLALQDSVVRGIMHALGRSIDTSAATSNTLEDPAARRAAWAEYLRGRQELRRRGKQHLRAAVSHFAAALGADAMLPQAYTGLADAWSLLPLYDPTAGQQPLSRALDAVDHALALDPKLPEARASRGHLLAGMWQWKEAESDLRAALAANATLVDAQQWLGEVLLITGRHAEAVKVLTAARALDPTSPVVVAIQGLALGVDGQFEAGMDAINTALRLDATFTEAYMFGGAVQVMAGKPAAAVAFLDRGAALAPDEPMLLGLLGQAKALNGDAAGARTALQQLNDLAPGIPRNAERAHIHLGLRDTTAAFAALDQAIADREPLFAAEPMGTTLFGAIRDTPHFAAALDKLGFGPDAIKAIRGSK